MPSNWKRKAMLETHFEEWLDRKDPLVQWRKKGWDRFSDIGWPKEPFQYIALKKHPIPKPANPTHLKSRSAHRYKIVFSDGYFTEAHLPDGAICLKLEEAIRPYAIYLQNRLSRTLKEETDPFAALNSAFHGRGAFLYVPPNRELEVSVEHLGTTDGMSAPRLMVYLGKGSRLKMTQISTGNLFACPHFDASLDAGSELTLFDAPETSSQSVIFQSIRASLKRDSKFSAHLYSEGGALCRTSARVQLLEENSEALLEGLWRLDEARECHIHALIEHLAPHTRSRQHFKGALKGRSKSSFEGKIYVHPTAQKTEAYQLNNNLLLSDEASAYAKPNLEIFADDVKASHGATISQLDAEDLFYLRSRGIPLDEAREILAEGFCREMAVCIPEGK